MLEVYEIKNERYFIEFTQKLVSFWFTSFRVYFLDLQSVLTEMNNMNET